MKCNKKPEVFSRIVGYFRPVQNWLPSKRKEFKDRKLFNADKIKNFMVDNSQV
jgi:ribonucleoside-triphosphate reductase